MATSTPKLDLSPSIYHQRVLANTKPAMSYDGGDFATWQKALRRKFRQMIGIMPKRSERPPLKPRVLWRSDDHRGLGTVEKIAFAAEEGSDVLAYWCVPHNVKPPYTTFICLQGHSSGAHNGIGVQRDDPTQPKLIEGDRDFGIGCMQRGIAALCIEQRAFGDRREQTQKLKGEQMCHDAVMQALMLGRTLAGERVGDVDRGIDYLASRGDIDMSRIGVMGNSGGGTTSIYAAALLPRIAFAMPSCSFCTYRDSIMSIHHCGDNYIPGLMLTAESADIVGLFAPRPVTLVVGRDDEIFPLKGARAAFKQVQRIYAAAGAPDNCKLVVGKGGHRFYADQGWRAMLKLMD